MYRTRSLLAAALLALPGTASLNAQTLRWEKLPGPEGGHVRSLTRTPDETLLAVLDTRDIYHSTNGGDSWSMLPSQSFPYQPVAIHSTSTGALLLATLDSTLFGSHLYRSTNVGRSWHEVHDDLYWRIPLVNDSSGGIIGAGIHDIYRSTDDGLTWDTIASFDEEISTLAVGADGRLVAAVEQSFSPRGVRVSTDLGETWSLVQIGDDTTPTIIALAATPNGDLFAGTGGGGLFRSDDGGTIWTEVSIERRFYYSSFAVYEDRSIAVATSDGVYRSTNRGDDWELVGNSRGRITTPVLLLTAEETLLAGTYNSGIYTVDGESWRSSSRGLPPLGAKRVAIAPDGTMLTVPANSHFLYSTDDGATWVEPDVSRYFDQAMTVDSEGNIYVGTWEEGRHTVIRSSDRGMSWTSGSSGIENEWILALHSGRNGRIYAGVERGSDVFHHSETDGLFVSTDRGESWSKLGTGLQGTSPVAIVELEDGTLFIGSRRERFVMRLDPGDTVWQEMTNGLPPSSVVGNQALHALGADREGNLYAGTQQGLFRSSNRGAHWERTGLEIADTTITALVLSPSGRLYAATLLAGVYASDDNGKTWKHQGDAPGATGFHTLAVDSSGALIAGNYTEGLYRGVVIPSSVSTEGMSRNAGLVSYPNPAGLRATVEFELAVTGDARLVLYSSGGERGMVIDGGVMSRGKHRIELDLSGYPSGSYRLVLETRRGSEEIGVTIVR